MAKVLGESRTGLLVAPDTTRYLPKLLGGSGKKVTGIRKIAKGRNSQFIYLLRSCNQAPLSSHRTPLVIKGKLKAVLSELGISKIKPPKWEETSDHLRAFYYQAAAETLGDHTFALTLNISPHIARKALDAPHGQSLDYLRRAVARNLKRHLGRSVDFWLVMETAAETESDRLIRRVLRQKRASGELRRPLVNSRGKQSSGHVGQPHLHGTLVIQKAERKTALDALRVINAGAKDEFKNNQICLKKISKGFGHAAYLSKHLSRTRIFLPDTYLMTTTNPIRRVAASLYEADRKFLAGLPTDW